MFRRILTLIDYSAVRIGRNTVIISVPTARASSISVMRPADLSKRHSIVFQLNHDMFPYDQRSLLCFYCKKFDVELHVVKTKKSPRSNQPEPSNSSPASCIGGYSDLNIDAGPGSRPS